MEFVQVLIHQHARTLVALKTLRSEVNTLRKVPPPPLKSTPPKVPSNSQDSGFSNATTNSSSDELYSLLSLIHDKVSVGVKNSNGGRSRVLGLQGEEAKLGYLDGLLGNEEFDFGRFTKIDRRVVKEILNCNSLDELRRQLLFTHAKVESLTAGKKQKEEEIVTPPPTTIPHPLPLALASKIIPINSVANTTTTVSVETDSNSNSNNHSSSCNLRSHGSGGGGGGGNNHHSSNQMRSLIPVPVRRLKNSANSNNNNNLDCSITTGKIDKPPPSSSSSSAIVNNKVKRLSNWKSYWFS